MSDKSWFAMGKIGAVIVAAGFCTFLQPIAASPQAMMLPVDPQPLIAETDAGERAFTIEVADDQNERAAGLMFRQTMAEDHGMLFVFEQTQQVGFWMKNTPLPLDLIFIGEDGRVRDILQGEPLSEALIAPAEPVRFVLEFKAGTAEKAGIEDGDLLRHPVISEAPGAGNPG